MSISIENVCFAYRDNLILNNINFSCTESGMIFVLGANGAGKSTLFKCILGQLKPQSGKILIDDKDVFSYSEKELASKVVYIPQSSYPTFNYSVREIILMGRSSKLSIFSSPGKEDKRIAQKVIEQLGIEKIADSGIQEISGGERQLVLIARALVQEAKILVMDEPTANLDYGNQIRVEKQLQELSKNDLCIIQSSHNPQQAIIFADRVACLLDGKICSDGKAKDVITEELIKTLYKIDIEIKDDLIRPIIN